MLKGPQLQDICGGSLPVLVELTSLSEATDTSVLVLAAGKLAQLLAKLLAASKRARDLKQPEYSSRVCSVLAASADVLSLLYKLQIHAENTLQLSDVLSRVVSAQQQVTQLLANQLRQQDQQPEYQRRAEQEQQQQQRQCLSDLAYHLLEWWLQAAGVKNIASGAIRTGGIFQPALDLAAVLAQSLTATSPPEFFTTISKVAYEQIVVVIFSAFSKREFTEDVLQLPHCPAFLQLSLAVLLLHSNAAQLDMLSSSSSRSNSSSGAGVSSAEACGCPMHAAPSTPIAQVQQQQEQQQHLQEQQQHLQERQQQQQQQEQQLLLAENTMLLWQAAGFAPSAMPAFRAAVSDPVLGVSDLLLRSAAELSENSFVLPPVDGPPALQGFILLAQTIQLPFYKLKSGRARAGVPFQDFDTFLAGAKGVDQLSRKQQQLLQALSRPLPLFLLQTALQCGGGCPAVTQVAARAAWCCLPCWILPGLGVTPASTTGAVAANTAQLLPLGPMLDCWQLLMKQQLLEQPAALLPMAAAAAQQLPGDSMQAQQLFSSRPCSCSRDAFTGADSAAVLGYYNSSSSSTGSSSLDNSRSLPYTTLNCELLLAVSDLLALLQPLSRTPCHDVWECKRHSMMVLLEVLARRVLSFKIICSTSQCHRAGSTNSSNGGVCHNQDAIANPDAGNDSSGSGGGDGSGSSRSTDSVPVLKCSMASIHLDHNYMQAMDSLYSKHCPTLPGLEKKHRRCCSTCSTSTCTSALWLSATSSCRSPSTMHLQGPV